MPTLQRAAFSHALGRLAGIVPPPLRAWWAGRDAHFRHRFWVSLVLVGVIEVALESAHRLHLPVVVRMENWGIDRTITFLGNRVRDRTDEPWVALTFLDIDERTWTQWRTPSVVPREKLQALIAWAAASGALAVVVDVDVSRPEGGNGRVPGTADSAFAEFLDRYRGPAPIILARTLAEPAGGTGLPSPRPGWFESHGLSDSAGKWLRWASVQFVQEPDGVVRRWRLWEPVCERGMPSVIPSVELLLPALVSMGGSSTTIDSVSLARLLDQVRPADCSAEEEHGAPEGEEPLSLWGHSVRVSSDLVPQRIVYQLRWAQGDNPLPRATVALPNGGLAPIFTRVSADLVTEGGEPPSSAALEGRVVIIGGSHSEARDLYQTPLGPMPGAMVIANAIASFRSHGQLQPLHGLWRLGAIVLLGVLTALAYARFHPVLATGITGFVLLFIVAPVSFVVFRGSIWLDFAVPLIGVQLHELIADLEDAWTLRGRRPDPPGDNV